MEQMALHQESAYERLYRWLQSQSLVPLSPPIHCRLSLLRLGECRLLTTESPEISMVISEALEGLRDRQVLFK